MKIALINGSPKFKNSASGYILKELKNLLKNDDNTIYEYCFRKPQLDDKEISELTKCNTLIFAFPLYVDAIPSHLISCFIKLEQLFSELNEKDINVYALVNCGFYEGHQNRIALEIMENWSFKAGLNWKQGIGIGAGGMITATESIPLGHGPKKNLGKALKKISENILKNSPGQNIFITANFPRFLYKFSAEMGWKQLIKKNGLQKKDLFLKR